MIGRDFNLKYAENFSNYSAKNFACKFLTFNEKSS